jgi:hypothetical protein
VVDHRIAGFGRIHGAEAFLGVYAMVELSERIDWRIDDVLGRK